MTGSRAGAATLRAMNVTSKLLRSSAAALAAIFLVAGPVSAVEEAPADTGAEAPAEEDEGGKIQIAATPRQQLGLVFLGALGLGGALAFGNARRQLKGERPQATGEFRWR
jgi:hypothetical protein